MKPVIIVSTFPNKTVTNKIANELVKKKLAACVNITKIDSVYSWKGKIQNDSEYLAIFKTTKKNNTALSFNVSVPLAFVQYRLADILWLAIK